MNNFYIEDLKEGARVHFVGIGGVSMSGLARILKKKGFEVTGSDMSESAAVCALRESGIVVNIGHLEENVDGADLVVYTAAVKKDNPELVAAEKKGIFAIERSILLGAVMRGFEKSIGIAGTHGKTTTTSMMSHVLLEAKLDPTISIGGNLDAIGGNIRTGKSEYFLTEACEYHRSFLEFFPTVAVVTNVDADHLDYFKDLEDIKSAFKKYLEIPDENGFAVVCGDDKNAVECACDVRGKLLTYGLDKKNDFYAENLRFDKNGCASFDACFGEEKVFVELGVAGKHNVLNALACFAVGYAIGIDMETVGRGVEKFQLVHRRFEKKGVLNGALIIDDYAHHPTEIKCTLKTAKEIAEGKVYVAFQPHTYTRTKALFDEFSEAFDCADEVVFADIYAAREKDTGLINSGLLAEAVLKNGVKASYMKEFDEIAGYFEKKACKGDIIISMGAGNIYEVSDKLIKK